MDVVYSAWPCIWCGEELDLENCESEQDIVYCSGCGGEVGAEYPTDLLVVQRAA